MEERNESQDERRRSRRAAHLERAVRRRARREQRNGSGIVLGMILILVGGILAADRLELIALDSPWRLWPLALVAVGIDKLVQAKELGPAHGGLWLLIGGAWLLVRNLRMFGPTFTSTWPLLLVGFGVALVWDSLLKGRTSGRLPGNGGGTA